MGGAFERIPFSGGTDMAVDEVSRVHVGSHSGHVSAESSVRAGSPLSWFQERLWVHYQRSPENTSYNLPLLLLIRGNLDVSALEQSLSEIVARHESLRTHYGQTDEGEPVQFVTAPDPVRLSVVAVDRAQLLEHLERHLEHRFDLQR